MNTSKPIFIWANSDLDGATSVILLTNMFRSLKNMVDIQYKSVFFGDFETQYSVWAEKELDNYQKVFIIGFPLTQTILNKFDDERLVFVSDRDEKVITYSASLFQEECSSCCKLLYRKFESLVKNVSDNVKKLVVYVDDYNNYDLRYEEAKFLNALYRNMGTRRFNLFVERFMSGYDGFSTAELTVCSTFFTRIKEEIKSLEIYTTTFKNWKIVATFSKMSVNEIAYEIMKMKPADVVIVVNPDTNFVSFRKYRGSSADIKFMAENLCGGGGGEWASGGKITQKFLDFSTKLVIDE